MKFRTVATDLACIRGQGNYSTKWKADYLHGIRWHFDTPYEADSDERICLVGTNGEILLVNRDLDGKQGCYMFSTPIQAGRFHLYIGSKAEGWRRAQVLMYLEGTEPSRNLL